MFPVYKLDNQGDNIQPWYTPFPIWNQSVVPCPVLTVASGPAYRFLRWQVRWPGIPISLRMFHSFLWSTQSLVSSVKQMFPWNSLAFSMIQWMLAIWSLVTPPFLNPVWTYRRFWFTYCWSLACRIFEYYLASTWNKHDCTVPWTFFGIAFLWDWNENWTFPVLWPLLSFPNFLAYWVQHFHSIIFQDLKSSTGIPSPPLALFVVMLSKAHLTSHSRISGSRSVITPSCEDLGCEDLFCTVLLCILATSS